MRPIEKILQSEFIDVLVVRKFKCTLERTLNDSMLSSVWLIIFCTFTACVNIGWWDALLIALGCAYVVSYTPQGGDRRL
jgi:hypothetical protein